MAGTLREFTLRCRLISRWRALEGEVEKGEDTGSGGSSKTTSSSSSVRSGDGISDGLEGSTPKL